MTTKRESATNSDQKTSLRNMNNVKHKHKVELNSKGKYCCIYCGLDKTQIQDDKIRVGDIQSWVTPDDINSEIPVRSRYTS